jgi:hypothetical protein
VRDCILDNVGVTDEIGSEVLGVDLRAGVVPASALVGRMVADQFHLVEHSIYNYLYARVSIAKGSQFHPH